jgi:hypothetical protein
MVFTNNWYLLVRALPELYALIGLVVVFSKAKTTTGRILALGLTGGLLAFLIRLIPVKFGIPTFLIIIMMTFLSRFVLNISYKAALSGVLFSFIILVALEWLTVKTLFPLFHISLEQAMAASDRLKFLLGLPNLVLLYVVLIALKIAKK